MAEFEKLAYFCIWPAIVLYSIYSFSTKTFHFFQDFDDAYGDFAPGWGFLGTKKDVVDFEWQTHKYIIQKLYLWLFAGIFISELLRKFALWKMLQIWNILLTAVFTFTEFGERALAMLFIQPLLFALFYLMKNKAAIWFCNVLALMAITVFKKLPSSTFDLSDIDAYVLVIVICWTNLRCTSYCLDAIAENGSFNFVELVSYALYLPTAFCGPFLPFKDYKGGASGKNASGDFLSRCVQLSLDLTRVLFWAGFMELCKHFIYVAAVKFHPQWIESLDFLSLCGYGYTMGQFFQIQYVILYGLSTSFAKFEGYVVPPLPICIGRVHLYSDMWKYFDVGLYNFLIRYIYKPSLPILKYRLIASLACFTFVYVWHGIQQYIFIWAFFNFIGVAVEQWSKQLSKQYESKVTQLIGPQWIQRLSCLAASPLLAMSAISNFCFFANVSIGNVFLYRILNGTFLNIVSLIAALYCCCQVSTELRRPDKTDKNKKYN